MIRFVAFLLALVLSVWIGITLKSDPGYALFSHGQYTVEMPLWLALTLCVFTFLILHWLLKMFSFSGSVSGRVKHWSNKRRLRAAHNRTAKGLIDLSEGNWRRAEKNLVKAGNDGDAPLINFLAAAKAAQEQGAYERRDNYLRKAHHINPEAKIAVELTQAELQIHHKQYEQALATLCHLRELTPKHNHVLKLLQSVYLQLNDWHSLIALIPEMKRLNIGKESQLSSIEALAYRKLLTSNLNNPKGFEALWLKLPKNYKSKADFISIHCEFLLVQGRNTEAEALIRDTLKKQWERKLVQLYGNIPEVNPKKQLLTAESWLKNNKNDVDLLICLGRLCKRSELWGQARSYFESSLDLKPTKVAYTELGQLFEAMNNIPMALDCYRKATTPI